MISLKDALRSIAPALGAAIGGPLGGALGIVSQVLLGKPDGKPDQVTAALATAPPEVLAALRKADQDFEAKMKELDIDLEKLAVDDRANARARQIALKDPTVTIMAAFTNALFATAFYVVCVRGVPAESKDLANIMLGGVLTMAVGVNTYYFGSSAGSRAKDQTIAMATANG